MESHWSIDLSLYKISSKTLYNSSEEIFKKKNQKKSYTYGVILLNFYEDNSPTITRSYFLQIFFLGYTPQFLLF